MIAETFEVTTMSTPADWRSLYPFDSRLLALGVGGRMHFLDEGDGQPLLMVHGNPTWSFYWRNLITAFRENHRCVAPDHMGCGMSDKPADYPYTLAQHTANLSKLIEYLDLQDITLLVHDWGGAIGLGAAVATPERFKRIVLFNTAAFPPPYVPKRIAACRIPLLGRFAIRGLNAFAGGAIWMATEKPERMTPQVKAGLLAPYDNWRHRVAVWRFVRDIPMTRRHPTRETLTNLEKALPKLADLPVKLIWGMRDWCFNEVCLDRFASIFPHAEIHRFDDAGHYVIEDAHERIIPLVEDFVGAKP